MMRTILFGQPEPIIEAYLEANDLWEAVEENYDVLPLPDNPTLAQIRNWKERKARNSKAKASLFSAISQENSLEISIGNLALPQGWMWRKRKDKEPGSVESGYRIWDTKNE